MMESDDIDKVVEELERVAENLNDIAMTILSRAIEVGETSRPLDEKRISQARRAVEKAIHHLRNGQ